LLRECRIKIGVANVAILIVNMSKMVWQVFVCEDELHKMTASVFTYAMMGDVSVSY